MTATWRLHAYVWYSENTTSVADEVEYITSPPENTLITSQITYHIPKKVTPRILTHRNRIIGTILMYKNAVNNTLPLL